MDSIDKINKIADRAREMEENDNHVTDSSRKRIVRAFEQVYRSYTGRHTISGYPEHENFTDRFIWIVFDY